MLFYNIEHQETGSGFKNRRKNKIMNTIILKSEKVKFDDFIFYW